MARQVVRLIQIEFIQIDYFFYLNKTHHLTSHLAKQTVVVFNVVIVYSVAVKIEVYIYKAARFFREREREKESGIV